MIYIKTDELNKVTTIHYAPFDVKHGMGKTEEELLMDGYLIEAIPDATTTENMQAILYYSTEEGCWYEYIDKPKNLQDELKELAQLKLEFKATQEAVDFLLMNGGI